jgi:hypothetical protein
MNQDKAQLIAFLATLTAIVVLVCVGAYVADMGKSTEALGIGAAATGLIGVIGTFRPKGPPMASTESGDVNVEAETKTATKAPSDETGAPWNGMK